MKLKRIWKKYCRKERERRINKADDFHSGLWERIDLAKVFEMIIVGKGTSNKNKS